MKISKNIPGTLPSLPNALIPRLVMNVLSDWMATPWNSAYIATGVCISV
jgi:hypothetical protein